MDIKNIDKAEMHISHYKHFLSNFEAKKEFYDFLKENPKNIDKVYIKLTTDESDSIEFDFLPNKKQSKQLLKMFKEDVDFYRSNMEEQEKNLKLL